MKSIIKEDNTSNKPFPKLMIFHAKDLIVLATDKNTGIVVYSELDKRPIGQVLSGLAYDYFTDFNGTIELSND